MHTVVLSQCLQSYTNMERYCQIGIARFVPAITFRRSPSGCTQNIFRGSKKSFCDFSVGKELENERTESVNNNENKNVDEFQEYILQQKTSKHESKNTKRHGVGCHVINPLLTKLVRSR